jgi:hypothetical protein
LELSVIAPFFSAARPATGLTVLALFAAEERSPPYDGQTAEFEDVVPQWWRENTFEIALAIVAVLIPLVVFYLVMLD